MASRKSNGNAVGAVARIVAVMTPVVVPLVNVVVDKLKEYTSKKTDWVVMPTLYDKQFPLNLDQAMELLSGYGLKGMPSMLTLREANAKYKDCFAGQVIDSNLKTNQKVQPGVTVIIRCVSQDVIDESQRLFDEAQKQKAEAKMAQAKKRSEQRERAMELTIDTANKAKCNVAKVISSHKKKVAHSDADSISPK